MTESDRDRVTEIGSGRDSDRERQRQSDRETEIGSDRDRVTERQ